MLKYHPYPWLNRSNKRFNQGAENRLPFATP